MKSIFCLLYLAACVTTFAQADNEKKLSKRELIEQADYYFFKENFDKALELYDSILFRYPKNHYTQYHKYVAHHLTEGRGDDLSGLKEFEQNEGHTDKFYNYWLGRIHHSRYEFDLAEEHFKAFLDLDIYRTREIIKESQMRLKDAQHAKTFYLNPNEYEVQLLESPINSEYADLSPAFFSGHSELLFVSARPDLANKEMAKNLFRIFHATKEGKNDWKQPSALDYLGRFEENNAKIEVVNNDGRLFVYKEDDIEGDLYFSEPDGSGWITFKEFDSDLRTRNVESDFFINDDENSVLFSSRGDKDDLDIYQSVLDPVTKNWSDPLPVSGFVNTQANEDSPFLSHDGKTLYFSSNRAESVGGYDIFKSEWNEHDQTWLEPVNLGFPINTIDDEINFQLNEDNISGFLSSNRLHGAGDYDIYYFHKQGKVLASGKVYDESNGELLSGFTVDFHPENYKDETFRVITDNYGQYSEEIFTNESFIVEISRNGQIFYRDRIESSHQELNKSFSRDFYITLPEKLDEKTDFYALYDDNQKDPTYEKLSMLGSKFRVGQKAMLKNIYFDVQSVTIKTESKPILNQLLSMMTEHGALNIEIAGHTDNSGPETVNQRISKGRAESVKSYLVNNGIPNSRISTKGFGSTKPLASNDDEKDGRELNRRIEVIVIE